MPIDNVMIIWFGHLSFLNRWDQKSLCEKHAEENEREIKLEKEKQEREEQLRLEEKKSREEQNGKLDKKLAHVLS